MTTKSKSVRTPMLMSEHEHDVLVKSDIVKMSETTPRPHADGCVGCRRAAACTRCGTTTERPDRCIAGACPVCCVAVHKHANDNNQDSVVAIV